MLSAISQKTKDVQKIVDRQAPVFDSPAKPKVISDGSDSSLVVVTVVMVVVTIVVTVVMVVVTIVVT